MPQIRETTDDLLQLKEEPSGSGQWYLVPSRIPVWGDTPVFSSQGVSLRAGPVSGSGTDYWIDQPSQWFWRARLNFTPTTGSGTWYACDYHPLGGTV